MSRKAEASAMGMAERAEGAAGRKKKAGPVVYCGPTVRGVAKQYTVFSGGIPEALEDFSERHPEVKALLVPVEQFAETRRKMETAGTAEASAVERSGVVHTGRRGAQGCARVA